MCFQCPDEKSQLFRRLPFEVIEATLAAFNDGHLSPDDACARLGIGRSRLYTLRTLWLAGGRSLPLAPSGGDHTAPWPDEAEAFLRLTLATGEPANFSFLADGLSLFGHESRKAGDTDTLSHFQRALGCLGVSHLVAKDPQSKGKIERQFGFWQKRLPALFAMESVRSREQANELLSTQIDWHHENHISRTTGMTPCQAVEKSESEGSDCWRPAPPPELLDLHLVTHHTRVVEKAGEISFLGRRWEITPGETKQVTIVQQPGSFRVISRPPTPQTPQWPDILAEYSL